MRERIEGSTERAHSRLPKKRHPSVFGSSEGVVLVWWLGQFGLGGRQRTKSIRDNNKNRNQPER